MTIIIGPNIKTLEKTANQADSIKSSVEVICSKNKCVTVQFSCTSWMYYCSLRGDINDYIYGDKISHVLDQVVNKVAGVKVINCQTMTCKSSKSPIKGKALKDLWFQAWHEIFNLSPPSAEELKQLRQAQQKVKTAQQKQSKERRAELLELLKNEHVNQWNRKYKEAVDVAPFRKPQLNGLTLKGLRFVDMPEGDFSHSDLTQAQFKHCNVSKSNFSGAVLHKAKFNECNLKHGNFQQADLSQAVFDDVKLQGADFTQAKLDNIKFKYAEFDETTQWPDNKTPADSGLIWQGSGPNPAALAELVEKKKHEGPVDMDTFMERVKSTIDISRVNKALKMLKKDRFQLFIEVGESSITGIVKSQNDPDLVYSCRLESTGSFACCTQNLNPCGGLRGALCKHIMVLIIGLANTGEFDPDTLDDWVQRSLLQEPALDKDVMGSILLKYKGADAGEIDWRPTETVPEDFYTF